MFNYRDKVVAGGVAGLLQRGHGGGPVPTVHGAVAEELIERLEGGQFRQARDAQAWIKKRTRKNLTESGVLRPLRRLCGKLKAPRKAHAKKAPAKAAEFKRELPALLTKVVGPAFARTVRLWVLDEHRYGLLPVIRRSGAGAACGCTRPTPPNTNGAVAGLIHSWLADQTNSGIPT